MQDIHVQIPSAEKTYPIIVGRNILGWLAEFIAQRQAHRRIVVISDDNVSRLHRDRFQEALAGHPLDFISIPPGEKSKTREMKLRIEDQLLEKQYGRDTLILALGGGVVGDLAGFVAATYNRGIPFVQVATSLLAMVDSSVGGKTGVDTPFGKNLIGAIRQPEAVFADLSFLDTLPQIEFINGLAEAIKIAIVLDREFCTFLEQHSTEILQKEPAVTEHVIRRSIELKKQIIETDETESGPRQVLNFGHTIGHALEMASDYRMKHGLCVAIGMIAESNLSEKLGELKLADAQRIIRLLRAFDFSLHIDPDFDTERLIAYMRSDKKAHRQTPYFILLQEIGRIKSEPGVYSFLVPTSFIQKVIEELKVC